MFPKEEDKNSDTLFLTCSFIHGINYELKFDYERLKKYCLYRSNGI